MKRESVKKLLKYLVICVLATYFVLGVVTDVKSYLHAKFIFSDVEKNGNKEELISELQVLEEAAQNMMNEYENKELPTLGATIATISYGRDYFALEMLYLSIIIGLIIGSIMYILKNVECKKIGHYIVIYLLSLILISLIFTVVTSELNSVNVEIFLESILRIVLPYTVGYILVCLIIFLASKNEAKELNDKI